MATNIIEGFSEMRALLVREDFHKLGLIDRSFVGLHGWVGVVGVRVVVVLVLFGTVLCLFGVGAWLLSVVGARERAAEREKAPKLESFDRYHDDVSVFNFNLEKINQKIMQKQKFESEFRSEGKLKGNLKNVSLEK